MKSKINKIIALCLVATVCVGLLFVPAPTRTVEAASSLIPIYMDRSYSFEERAADLVARLTLNEKISQLMTNSNPAIPPRDDLPSGLQPYNYWSETLHGLSRIGDAGEVRPPYLDNCTSYPISSSMGMTWDPELQFRTATEIGNECREAAPGADRMLVHFSPTINLARDPRWGRNDESMGEDPFLTAAIASQFVNGLEGKNMDGSLIDPNGYYKVASTIKHYLANNSEVNRLNGASYLTEQEMREYYTYSFRRIIQNTNITSVMNSYNRIHIKDSAYSLIDEMPGGINLYAQDTILRQTIGLSGHIVSDCDSVNVAIGANANATPLADQLATRGTNHQWRAPSYTINGVTTPAMTANMTKPQAVAWSLLGSMDLECNGGTTQTTLPVFTNDVNSAIAAGHATPFGKITENAVDVSSLRTLTTRVKLGEFDDKVGYTAQPVAENSSNIVSWFDQALKRISDMGKTASSTSTLDTRDGAGMTDERLALAREAAAKSLVLLKNDPVADNGDKPLLPITVPASGAFKVAVYGLDADNVFLGAYSTTRPVGGAGLAKTVTPYGGIRDAIKAINPNAVVDLFPISSGNTLTAADNTSIAQAGGYNYVVVVANDRTRDAGETGDRTDINMKRNLVPLINSLYVENKKLVTLMLTYCPLDISGVDASMPALLNSCFGGDRIGEGLADVLLGVVNPSARTNASWYPSNSVLNPTRSYQLSPGPDGPWSSLYGDTPSNLHTYDGPNYGRTYMYYSGPAVRFPFGYGLSYTSFEYSNLRVSGVTGPNNVSGNGTVTLTFDVKNIGNAAGSDCAQLYVKTPPTLVEADRTYAIKRLRGFEQVYLNPDETKSVSFSVNIPDIAFYSNSKKKFEVVWDKGAYEFQISRSSDDNDCQLYAMISVTGDIIPEPKVLTFKPNTPADAAADVPQRVIYTVGDSINPNPTLAMNNDVLYGYINKAFSCPIPANIAIKYSSNRPWVVSTSADGARINAIGGGVATITATATDSVTGKSTEGHFVVYVEGDEYEDFDISLKSITAGEFSVTEFESGVYGFDINMAKGVTTPPTVNAVLNDFEASTIEITQAASVPGTASITVTDKKIEGLSRVYRVNFGYMTIGQLYGAVNSESWNAASDIRFSDGETSFVVILAAYDKRGAMVYNTAKSIPALPKNAAGVISNIAVPAATGYDPKELTYKAFLWNPNFVPYVPAYDYTYK